MIATDAVRWCHERIQVSLAMSQETAKQAIRSRVKHLLAEIAKPMLVVWTITGDHRFDTQFVQAEDRAELLAWLVRSTAVAAHLSGRCPSISNRLNTYRRSGAKKIRFWGTTYGWCRSTSWKPSCRFTSNSNWRDLRLRTSGRRWNWAIKALGPGYSAPRRCSVPTYSAGTNHLTFRSDRADC